MSAPVPHPRPRAMTLEAFLEFAEATEDRWEYAEGMAYAMTPPTRRHDKLALNIVVRLCNALGEGPCRVHHASQWLRADRARYVPDVMVACGPEPEDQRSEDAPCLLVEVTSPSTETLDRRAKWSVYRELSSLDTYLIVSQEERRVDRYWRDATGGWQVEALAERGEIPLPLLGITLTLADMYKGVELPSLEQRLRLREEEAAYG